MSHDQLHCNRCGTELMVPSATNFVACGSCGTRLAVRRNGAAVYTEEIAGDQPVAAPAGRDGGVDPVMQARLDELERETALNRLDREWDRTRESYMMHGKHGHRYTPTKFGAIAMTAVIVVFGVFWTGMAASMMGGFGGGGPGGPPGIFGLFPLFGVIFILFGIGMGVYTFSRADALEKEKRRYERRRRELLYGDGSEAPGE